MTEKQRARRRTRSSAANLPLDSSLTPVSSTDSPPPSKKCRASEEKKEVDCDDAILRDEVKEEEETREPHDTLWFEDGTVVLATENVLFRVHRGVLAKNSPVFAAMFMQPDGSEDSEKYEGLPLVHLADDDDEDVEHFLSTLYDRVCVYCSFEAAMK